MVNDFDAFVRPLGGGALAPVYLIAGDEPLQLQEAGDALRASARAHGYTEREVLDVDAHFDWDRVARSGSSLSLFATRRLIELRLPTGRPDREGSAVIVAWCKAPVPDTLLLVTAAEWSRKHEGVWVKAVERVGVYAWLRAPTAAQLPAWIGARMRTRGFTPEADAVALLATRAEGNLLAIAQAIDKLAAERAGGPVTAADFDALGSDDAIYSVFNLTDAAFGGETRRALTILEGLRAEGEDLIPMLGWVTNQVDLALRLAGAADFAAGARAEYNFWPARQRLFAGALKRAGHGTQHWRRCLAQCGYIDRIVKGRVPDQAGRAMGDAWREMERLVVALAQPDAAAALLAA